MTFEPTIGPAGDGDLDAVPALWRAAGAQPTVTDDAVAIALLRDADPGALLVAKLDAELVGTLIAAWDGWRGSFYRLAVHPDRRRLGIATRLLRSGEERLRGLGAARLTAIVAEDEEDIAGAFWEAAGYTRQERRGRYVLNLGG